MGIIFHNIFSLEHVKKVVSNKWTTSVLFSVDRDDDDNDDVNRVDLEV